MIPAAMAKGPFGKRMTRWNTAARPNQLLR
jgi:hypothetical protein